jgi:hypothetical protein
VVVAAVAVVVGVCVTRPPPELQVLALNRATPLPPPPLLSSPQGDQFGYCPPWALCWPYRKANLLKELLAYDADILCLQEVQSNHFQVRARVCVCARVERACG